MNNKKDHPLIRHIKNEARKLETLSALTHTQALELCAQKTGFATYAALRANCKSLGLPTS